MKSRDEKTRRRVGVSIQRLVGAELKHCRTDRGTGSSEVVGPS